MLIIILRDCICSVVLTYVVIEKILARFVFYICFVFFFFKHETAYELRISDWSSDVCSSDLAPASATSSAANASIRKSSRSCLRPRRRAANPADAGGEGFARPFPPAGRNRRPWCPAEPATAHRTPPTDPLSPCGSGDLGMGAGLLLRDGWPSNLQRTNPHQPPPP